MAKQYGLSFPKDKGHKIGQVSAIRPSVFDSDSDSEAKPVKPTGISRGTKKQDVLNQEKALADDPTVYQYDEVYEEMEKTRNDSKLAKKDVEKKPKYINRLLAAADKRKKENDRRIERQVQKEREEEGDMFKDKESFITPSYKKKLEEMRQLEEEEKREEYLESIGDVKKQGNLDGFYRHLYEQKVSYEDKKEEPEKNDVLQANIKQEDKSDNEKKLSDGENKSLGMEPKKVTRRRKYRTRKDSKDASDIEEQEIKKEHLPSNIDADSDFSVDSPDSEDEENNKKEPENNKPEPMEPEKTDKVVTEKPVEVKEEEKKDEKPAEVKIKEPKIDVWKKRTVGEKFDEAVKRYFERKALREALN